MKANLHILAPHLSQDCDPFDSSDEIVQAYANQAENHPWFIVRQDLIVRTVEGLGRGMEIMDVGCGPGLVCEALYRAGYSVLGMDQSVRQATLAAERHPNIAFVQFDLNAVPQSYQEKFDLLLLLDVLEHVDDDRAFLENASSLLKPDGRILITVPAKPHLWSAFDEAWGHLRRYKWKDLQDLIQRVGFETVLIHSAFFSLLPLLYFRPRAKGFRSENELLAYRKRSHEPPPGWVGFFLKILLRLDIWISRRFKFREFGTSMILVAKKRS